MKTPPARFAFRLPLALLGATLTLACPLHAQDEPAASAAAKPFVIPPDINGLKTIVAAPESVRPLRIALYDGPGAGDAGVDNVEARARELAGTVITRLTPAEIGTAALSARFDVIVFSGGSGSAQSKAIGEAGRENVREFVKNGGGYVGVCAGAYLACAGFEWGLGILDARTVSSKWRRGRTFLDIELSPAGRELFGPVDGTFKVRYANGPVIKPLKRDDIPDYTPISTFRTEIAENDTPAGVQIGSPAQAIGTFGMGRVFVSSPHPENTPGLENMIPRALLWSAGAAKNPASP
jgi:hypothetical protein